MALPPQPLHGLALFAGGAGLELGIERFLRRLGRPSRTVCFVEREAYAAAVLVSRMAEGRLAPAPIWSDVTTFDGRPWRGVVDFIAGGFPCQDISNAGKRAGLVAGERSGLWREYARLIGEVGPRLVFVENVRPLLVRGIDVVLGDLADMGFDAEWLNLRASDVGAPHGRDRIFLLAYARGDALWKLPERDQRKGRRERAAERGDAIARESGEAMGDSGCLQRVKGRSPIASEAARGRAPADSRGRGERVADADREGLAEPERSGEHARSGSTLERGGELADPEHARRGSGSEEYHDNRNHAPGGIVDRCDAGLGEHGPTPWRDVDGRFRAWPPGPRESAGWRLFLEQYPDLAPAVSKARRGRGPVADAARGEPGRTAPGAQSLVRRGTDGLAAGMEHRVDALRLNGNGVVPFQAARAFELLAAKIPKVEAWLKQGA